MASPKEPHTLENEGGSKSGGSADEKGGGGDAISEPFEYYGWVYHLGVHKIDFAHRRFLWIRGTYLQMFKRDPHEHHGTVSLFFTI